MSWAYANGYSDDLTLDRIDPRGNYEPSNCRWVTQKVQQNNRSNNVRITYNGETHNIEEWSEITGLPEKVIYDRNHRGWPVERVFGQKRRRAPTKKSDKVKNETTSFRIYFDSSDREDLITTAVCLATQDEELMKRISDDYGRKDAVSYEFPNGLKMLTWRNVTGIVFDFRTKSLEEMYHDKRPDDKYSD